LCADDCSPVMRSSVAMSATVIYTGQWSRRGRRCTRGRRLEEDAACVATVDWRHMRGFPASPVSTSARIVPLPASTRKITHALRNMILPVLRIRDAVLRIHDILGWIRIRIHGSMPLTNGSGSGSCYYRYCPSRCQQKTKFLTQFFLLITF
jgi:hypothetical protein